MTAIHPHQLKPDEQLRNRALVALCYARSRVPLAGVPTITSYLRKALRLSVHRELLLAWLAAGMPHERIHKRGGEGSPVTVVTTNIQALGWLASNGSIPGARLCPLVGRGLRVSRSLTPKSISRNRARAARRDNNPTRTKKASKSKSLKGRVNDV